MQPMLQQSLRSSCSAWAESREIFSDHWRRQFWPGWTQIMTTFDFICAVGQVSMPPIRVHRPTPTLICSAGYSIWWPEGKEFQNDRYAECVKDEPAVGVSKSTPVDMKKRNNAHSNRAELKKSFAQVAKKCAPPSHCQRGRNLPSGFCRNFRTALSEGLALQEWHSNFIWHCER